MIFQPSHECLSFDKRLQYRCSRYLRLAPLLGAKVSLASMKYSTALVIQALHKLNRFVSLTKFWLKEVREVLREHAPNFCILSAQQRFHSSY